MQLITYANRLGGDLRGLHALLRDPLQGSLVLDVDLDPLDIGVIRDASLFLGPPGDGVDPEPVGGDLEKAPPDDAGGTSDDQGRETVGHDAVNRAARRP